MIRGDKNTRDSLIRYSSFAIIVVVAAAIPQVVDLYQLSVINNIFILAFFGVAFNLAFGFTNLPSFGHAAFYGIGAYGFSMSIQYLNPSSIVVPVIIGIGGAMIFSFFMGIFSLRGRGIYFALLTFAFAQFVYEFVIRFSGYTGGTDGLLVFVPRVFGIRLGAVETIYYLSFIALVVLLLILRRILQSPFGRVMQAIRHNPDRTNAIGYPVKKVQISVFVISGSLASIAGILHAIGNQFVSPDVLHWQTSIDVLVISIIGGMHSLIGPVVGAVFLLGLDELTRGLANIGIIITGLAFIAIILLASDGVMGLLASIFDRSE